MLVRRCDNCKKIIDRQENDYLEISKGWHKGVEICLTCAKPFISAFSEQQLLPKKIIKALQLAAD